MGSVETESSFLGWLIFGLCAYMVLLLCEGRMEEAEDGYVSKTDGARVREGAYGGYPLRKTFSVSRIDLVCTGQASKFGEKKSRLNYMPRCSYTHSR